MFSWSVGTYVGGDRVEEAADPRQRELAGNLAVVRNRIAAACARTGRDPSGVILVAVTKTFPAGDVVRLAGLGVRDIGENRDQEAAPKAAEVAATGAQVRWHFVGQLQRNKCRSVVEYADLVHSVDRVRLATALDAAADESTRLHRASHPSLDVLVQVSLDGNPTRGGAIAGAPDADHDLDRVVDAIAGAARLRLSGVMTVAPLEWEAARAYSALAEIVARLRADHPAATVVSAGMSDDIEEAINHGATHVRIGRALLGNRPPLR
jgi:pyridoxal phosphate enzyme (YggS family)